MTGSSCYFCQITSQGEFCGYFRLDRETGNNPRGIPEIINMPVKPLASARMPGSLWSRSHLVIIPHPEMDFTEAPQRKTAFLPQSQEKGSRHDRWRFPRGWSTGSQELKYGAGERGYCPIRYLPDIQFLPGFPKDLRAGKKKLPKSARFRKIDLSVGPGNETSPYQFGPARPVEAIPGRGT